MTWDCPKSRASQCLAPWSRQTTSRKGRTSFPFTAWLMMTDGRFSHWLETLRCSIRKKLTWNARIPALTRRRVLYQNINGFTWHLPYFPLPAKGSIGIYHSDEFTFGLWYTAPLMCLFGKSALKVAANLLLRFLVLSSRNCELSRWSLCFRFEAK